MGNSAVKQHLQNAEKTGVCQLGKMGIEEVPPALHRLVGNLRTLDMSENKIIYLPANMGDFGQLKSLNISNNRIVSLPENIGKLKRIETLIASHNHITGLTPTVCKLNTLKIVSFGNNNLTKFPMELCGLRCLNVLELQSNKIAEVPDGVETLQCIELNLNQNQISKVSARLAECPRLKCCDCEYMERYTATKKKFA
ncbi:PREDICTED: leucine-rich repeat-containing protein 57-like [Priapulus caudatus]|uniref:Leucine-rich repeat-containing protein 57-like n=1 Tax=Priapulus caudatus TaxID=37621 RepID=A0ABM1DVN2_PRICU|nr:PREDICTED: leucine-rich repeat-containing protein 57-like [Priapulus caudatus]